MINYHDEQKIDLSKTVSTASLECAQFSNEPNNFEKSDFLSFLFENLNILTYILIGYLLCLIAVAFLFQKFKFKRSLSLLFQDYRQLCSLSSKIAIIVLSFNLFLFILITSLKSFINTNKILINTDEFLNSNEKLIETSKILTIFSYHLKTFRKGAKSSLLTKLINRKIKEKKYLIFGLNAIELREKFLKNDVPSLFFLFEKRLLLHYISLYLPLTRNQIVFKKLTNLFEQIQVIFLSKSLKSGDKKFIKKR